MTEAPDPALAADARSATTDPLAGTPSPGTPSGAPATMEPALAALRAEIDGLDDAIHDLLMRRAAVVARMAGSRAKAGGPTLRPGREAQVLRRLLARNAGAPLPPAAVVRLWRDIFAVHTAMQAPYSVAVCAAGPEHMRVTREHFGALTPLHRVSTPSRALAMVAAGEASVAALPLPDEAEPPEQAWWTGLDSPRLQVAARLPILAGAPGAALSGAQVLVVGPGAPDPSGDDRSLLRLEAPAAAEALRGRGGLQEALAAAGFAPTGGLTLLRRDGTATLGLAEVAGVVDAADPRLARLSVARALPLGFYAVPLASPA